MTYAIAVLQVAAVALILSAVWQKVDGWSAVGALGVVVLIAATGLERMTLDR